MSNWTKIFIILLSVASIFLSAAVIAFVGSTQNYKSVSEDQKTEMGELRSTVATYYQTLEEKNFQMKEAEKKYAARIVQIEGDMQKLIEDKRTTDTELNEAKAKLSTLTGAFSGFDTTIANLNKTLELTENELKELRAKGIKSDAKLAQLEAELYEKIVQLKQLGSDLRNLHEQKKSIEDRLSSIVGTGSGDSVIPGVVTVPPDKVIPAEMTPADSAIKGQVTDVTEALVIMNVGSADGVKVGTEFFVVRGEMFICSVKVTDVDVNVSAGTMSRVMVRPKIGDSVSTTL